MSEHERDSVMPCLYSGQDMKLRNIRFARGSEDIIAEPNFRAAIEGAAEQRRSGTAKAIGWPSLSEDKVDAHTFVANI